MHNKNYSIKHYKTYFYDRDYYDINDAVIKGRLDIVQSLCNEGYNINERSLTDLSTPLMNSIFFGHDLITIYLIKNGADLNIRDKDGYNVLMISILANNESIATILIYYGVDINMQTNHGITALMFASSNGLINIVSMLIKAGADINLKNSAGETALVNAIQEGNHDIAKLLKNHGAIE